MRFAILALSSSHGPWHDLLKEGPEKTWLPESHPAHYAKIIAEKHGFFDSFLNQVFNSRYSEKLWRTRPIKLNEISCLRINEDELVVNLSENWTNLVAKCLKGFEYALDNWEFDYLIRINSTAYVDVDALSRYLKDFGLPDYAGPMMAKKSFISGWAIILSKRALKILVNTEEQEMIFDDEFVGKTLERHGIFPTEIPYIEVNNYKKLFDIIKTDCKDIALWRFKSLNNLNTRDDANLMNSFHRQRSHNE